MTDDGVIGRVAALYRYPVKSMLGEALEVAEVGERGVAGDRAYALVDRDDGKVASAKNPRKWGALLRCRATYVEPPSSAGAAPVRITLPDGTEVRSDSAGADAVLSRFVGRDVTLVAGAPEGSAFEEVWPDDVGAIAPEDFIERTESGREPTGERVSDITTAMAAPPGTFFDVTPLHLLTTATLERLAALAPASDFDVRRYRPNVLIDAEEGGFLENDWAGRTIRLGEAAASGMLPTMRCVMTTLAQDGLDADRSTLQAIAEHNRIEIPGLGTWACAGIYAGVAAAGVVRVGDEVRLDAPS